MEQQLEFNNVKRIGIIADIHAKPIPKKVFEIFKTVDLILVAGDVVDIKAIEELEKIAKVIAVHGNMDSDDIKEKLPKKIIIKINNFKIGLIHGDGQPEGLVNYTKNQFNEKLDCIIFGHSHSPFNEIIGGTLFFNPGCATPSQVSDFESIGILTINNEIEGETIKL